MSVAVGATRANGNSNDGSSDSAKYNRKQMQEHSPSQPLASDDDPPRSSTSSRANGHANVHRTGNAATNSTNGTSSRRSMGNTGKSKKPQPLIRKSSSNLALNAVRSHSPATLASPRNRAASTVPTSSANLKHSNDDSDDDETDGNKLHPSSGGKKSADMITSLIDLTSHRQTLTTPIHLRTCARCCAFDIATRGKQKTPALDTVCQNDSLNNAASKVNARRMLDDDDSSDDSDDDDSVDERGQRIARSRMVKSASTLLASPINHRSNLVYSPMISIEGSASPIPTPTNSNGHSISTPPNATITPTHHLSPMNNLPPPHNAKPIARQKSLDSAMSEAAETTQNNHLSATAANHQLGLDSDTDNEIAAFNNVEVAHPAAPLHPAPTPPHSAPSQPAAHPPSTAQISADHTDTDDSSDDDDVPLQQRRKAASKPAPATVKPRISPPPTTSRATPPPQFSETSFRVPRHVVLAAKEAVKSWQQQTASAEPPPTDIKPNNKKRDADGKGKQQDFTQLLPDSMTQSPHIEPLQPVGLMDPSASSQPVADNNTTDSVPSNTTTHAKSASTAAATGENKPAAALSTQSSASDVADTAPSTLPITAEQQPSPSPSNHATTSPAAAANSEAKTPNSVSTVKASSSAAATATSPSPTAAKQQSSSSDYVSDKATSDNTVTEPKSATSAVASSAPATTNNDVAPPSRSDEKRTSTEKLPAIDLRDEKTLNSRQSSARQRRSRTRSRSPAVEYYRRKSINGGEPERRRSIRERSRSRDRERERDRDRDREPRRYSSREGRRESRIGRSSRSRSRDRYAYRDRDRERRRRDSPSPSRQGRRRSSLDVSPRRAELYTSQRDRYREPRAGDRRRSTSRAARSRSPPLTPTKRGSIEVRPVIVIGGDGKTSRRSDDQLRSRSRDRDRVAALAASAPSPVLSVAEKLKLAKSLSEQAARLNGADSESTSHQRLALLLQSTTLHVDVLLSTSPLTVDKMDEALKLLTQESDLVKAKLYRLLIVAQRLRAVVLHRSFEVRAAKDSRSKLNAAREAINTAVKAKQSTTAKQWELCTASLTTYDHCLQANELWTKARMLATTEEVADKAPDSTLNADAVGSNTVSQLIAYATAATRAACSHYKIDITDMP